VAEDVPFQELIARVRAGDDAAAREVVRRYEPAIRRTVRIRLADPRLRRFLDSMDICQSVFGSFFVRVALGQYDLEDPQQLLRLLLNMSRKKLIDHERRERAARRDFRRVEASGEAARDLPATDDSPSQQAALGELLQEMRKRLSPEERDLAEQRAQGREWAQIAAERGSSPEALRKQLNRAVERAAGELGIEV
jgi:RNA polymerase sigma-70 factor (ECF subfamily)